MLYNKTQVEIWQDFYSKQFFLQQSKSMIQDNYTLYVCTYTFIMFSLLWLNDSHPWCQNITKNTGISKIKFHSIIWSFEEYGPFTFSTTVSS